MRFSLIALVLISFVFAQNLEPLAHININYDKASSMQSKAIGGNVREKGILLGTGRCSDEKLLKKGMASNTTLISLTLLSPILYFLPDLWLFSTGGASIEKIANDAEISTISYIDEKIVVNHCWFLKFGEVHTYSVYGY